MKIFWIEVRKFWEFSTLPPSYYVSPIPLQMGDMAILSFWKYGDFLKVIFEGVPGVESLQFLLHWRDLAESFQIRTMGSIVEPGNPFKKIPQKTRKFGQSSTFRIFGFRKILKNFSEIEKFFKNFSKVQKNPDFKKRIFKPLGFIFKAKSPFSWFLPFIPEFIPRCTRPNLPPSHPYLPFPPSSSMQLFPASKLISLRSYGHFLDFWENWEFFEKCSFLRAIFEGVPGV